MNDCAHGECPFKDIKCNQCNWFKELQQDKDIEIKAKVSFGTIKKVLKHIIKIFK